MKAKYRFTPEGMRKSDSGNWVRVDEHEFNRSGPLDDDEVRVSGVPYAVPKKDVLKGGRREK